MLGVLITIFISVKHIKMKKSQVPCQAVYNKLFVDNISEEISCLN